MEDGSSERSTSAKIAKRLNVDCTVKERFQYTRLPSEDTKRNASIYLHEIQHTLLQATGKQYHGKQYQRFVSFYIEQS